MRESYAVSAAAGQAAAGEVLTTFPAGSAALSRYKSANRWPAVAPDKPDATKNYSLYILCNLIVAYLNFSYLGVWPRAGGDGRKRS